MAWSYLPNGIQRETDMMKHILARARNVKLQGCASCTCV